MLRFAQIFGLLLVIFAHVFGAARAGAPGVVPEISPFAGDHHEGDGAAMGDGAEADEDEDKNGYDLPLKPERKLTFSTDEGTWMSLDVSPDGGTIVFELLGDLYTVPMSGGAATLISGGMAFDSTPAYSPDGAKIAFISDRAGSNNLWIADADGSNAKQLSKDSTATMTSPVFSPDGDYVVVAKSPSAADFTIFELWMYHVKGGSGIQITSKGSGPRPFQQNALGPNFSPDGKYLYYSARTGGFTYNAQFPLWNVSRRDMTTGETEVVVQAYGSAIRPIISPDGNYLVYGTRYDAETGLRIRDLRTGDDRWLAYPVTRDEQESAFSRDLLPGAAFTPDSRRLVMNIGGKIQAIDIATGEMTVIPFTADIDQDIGPDLHIAQTEDTGPVRARIIQSPDMAPDGNSIVFSALGNIYTKRLPDGAPRRLTNADAGEFQPSYSPDGRWIAYITWTADGGGHIWRVRATGGRPQRLTTAPGYYANPVFTPDGGQIIALRGSRYDYINRPNDFGLPPGSDLVRLPAGGGDATLVAHAGGLTSPHFGPERDRVYVYTNEGLVSMRFDGTDRRTVLSVTGPGGFFSNEPVPAGDVRISPNGRWALAQVSNEFHLIAVPIRFGDAASVNISGPAVPTMELTDIGADYMGWSDDGEQITWAIGSTFYRRAMSTISFDEEEDDDASEATEGDGSEDASPDASDADEASGDDGAGDDAEESEDAKEEEEKIDPATLEPDYDNDDVEAFPVIVEAPRDVHDGVALLRGARIVTMSGDEVIENGEILVRGNRIAAVGPAGSLDVPRGADVVDVSGKTIVPGYIDTHAHWFEIRRGVLDTEHWGFLANVAYGVTAGLDVQTATNDMFAYQDMIDSGRMIGLRAYSTGPGVFGNNAFESKEEAMGVLKRYRDHYRTRNIKAYVSGERKQRQWVIEASKELGMMPTTEGALDLALDMTHAIDGFSGNEHSIPVTPLYKDIVELFAQTKIGYTPTLLVSYGGPWAENYYYTRENPRHDPKLNRFMPHDVLEPKTQRRFWFRDEEHVFTKHAEQAAKILRAGGLIGVGSHGQLQGLGYHWELWSVASGGMTPMEALRSATINGATIIGREAEIGSIEAGKFADLVILNSNPLDNIRNSADIDQVMQNGRLYDGDTMDQQWPEQRPLPELWFADEAPN